MEQADKKNRVEARERAERLNYEKRLEESEMEKEAALARLEAAEEAKFEATRKIAAEKAIKRVQEEFEMQRKVKPLYSPEVTMGHFHID